MYLPFDVIK